MTARSRHRRLAAAAAPLLLAMSLTACGGDAESAPQDASVDDFCAVAGTPPDAMNDQDADKAADAAHEWAADLTDVGTPAEFDADARSGFVLVTGFLADVDSGDVQALVDGDENTIFSDAEVQKVVAFYTAQAAACGPDLGDAPDSGDLESQLPTELPS